MSRRPDDVRGDLIFQEGKCIEGDYYIVAVYDDPAHCIISFSAYELENDRTYTIAFSYSEFDALFRFDAERMNPANQDGRFDWVIKRLDFIVDDKNMRVLCLANEPTPDPDEDLVDTKPAKSALAPVNNGNIDAATRARLLKELSTQDDEKLHKLLVRSEEAGKRFLLDLHKKRQLEQLKAAYRLLKADEKREARLAKLEFIKKQQAEKAEQIKAKEKAKQSVQSAVEELLKAKEAQAIRRLIAEKEEEERGMKGEKDAARARRKMGDRIAAETKKLEEDQAKKIGGKRDTKVAIEERKIVAYSKEIAEKVAEFNRQEAQREADNGVRREIALNNSYAEKLKVLEVLQKKEMLFNELEKVRDAKNDDKHRKRAKVEGVYVKQMQAERETKLQETLRRRRNIHREMLRQWKGEIEKRHQDKESEKRKKERREKSIAASMEVTLRRFRETQFLETATARGQQVGEEGEEEGGGAEKTLLSQEEAEEFRRTFEQQERQKRYEAIAEKRKQEEEKLAKLQNLSGKDPNAKEMEHVRQMKETAEQRTAVLEAARREKDLELERSRNEAIEKSQRRNAMWEDLEKRRREASLERHVTRTKVAARYARSSEKGAGLPLILIY